MKTDTPSRPRVCVVCTTPLMIHLFLRDHISRLSQFADVTILTNLAIDTQTPPLNLPVRMVFLPIERQIAPWRDLKCILRLMAFLSRERFDLVWAAGPKAGLLGMISATITRVPRRLFIFQGEVWASGKGLRQRILKFADTVTARLSTHLLAVSQAESEFLEAQKVVRPQQVKVLGVGSIGGVDTQAFRPDADVRRSVRQDAGIPDDAAVVLFVGRLNPDKGIADLALAFRQALKSNDKLWLLIVGPDEAGMQSQLRGFLGEPGLSSRYTMEGFSSNPAPYFCAADIFCLPSYREGFPVSLLEAAATGIPAIGSDIYGIRGALVDGATGILFPVRDVSSLSNAMLLLADDPALRLRMGQAARTRVTEHYQRETVLMQYEDYLKSLLIRSD